MLVQDDGHVTAGGFDIVSNYIHDTGDYTTWLGGGTAILARNLRNSRIEGNEITNNGDSAIVLSGSGYQAANVVIRNNNIHYNGRDGITGGGTDILVEHNRMYDNCHTMLHQDGIELWQCDGWIIRNNILGDYTQLVYGGMNPGATEDFVNLQVYGNVFYNSIRWARPVQCGRPVDRLPGRRQGQPAWRHPGAPQHVPVPRGQADADQLYGSPGLKMSNVAIHNNIFYQCGGSIGGYAYGIDQGFTKVRANNNCFDNVLPNLDGQDRVQILADPRFVNYTVGAASFDVRLQPGSPCIDAGAAVGTRLTLPDDFVDIDGHPRPSGGALDIGAYEH